MGVTVTKGPKAKTAKGKQGKAAVKAAPQKGVITGYEADVDRLAEITAKLAPLTNLMKEASVIEKKLREVADEAVAAEETATVTGTKHNYCVKERTMARSITDMAQVRKQMGDPLFMEVAKVTLADIDKYLTEEQKSNVLVQSRTGSRRGELVDKG